MAYEHIMVAREDGVGIVTLNRPEVLNAINRKLGAELLDAVKTLDADDAIGCRVITGAGGGRQALQPRRARSHGQSPAHP
jgi:enoyl-CoA hydratase